ncbi:MAG: hypothetical protein OEM40_05130, partial [Acidimicrobiia bacterium]|nr:hypothetical protein [Acidimicrobiia bacterium]
FIVTGLAVLPVGVGLVAAWAVAGASGVTLGAVVALVYGGGVMATGLWLGGSLFDERAVKLIEILDGE